MPVGCLRTHIPVAYPLRGNHAGGEQEVEFKVKTRGELRSTLNPAACERCIAPAKYGHQLLAMALAAVCKAEASLLRRRPEGIFV